MWPYHFKPLSRQLLELVGGMLLLIVLLPVLVPVVLVAGRSLILPLALLAVAVIAVRGLGSYAANRRERW